MWQRVLRFKLTILQDQAQLILTSSREIMLVIIISSIIISSMICSPKLWRLVRVLMKMRRDSIREKRQFMCSRRLRSNTRLMSSHNLRSSNTIITVLSRAMHLDL
jgi:hypothetical protein